MCSVLSSHDQAMQLDCADFSSETSHIHLAWLENGNVFSRLHFYITNQFHTGLDITRKQLLQPAFKGTKRQGSNCKPVASANEINAGNAVAAVFTTADCIFTLIEQWLAVKALFILILLTPGFGNSKGKQPHGLHEEKLESLSSLEQPKQWLSGSAWQYKKTGQMKLINFTGPLEQMFIHPPT